MGKKIISSRCELCGIPNNIKEELSICSFNINISLLPIIRRLNLNQKLNFRKSQSKKQIKFEPK